MIEIIDSKTTFESVYQSDYAPDDIAIRDANMLLLPYHNIRPNVEYCFGEYAEEFLRYAMEKKPPEIKPDIAISDDKYQAMEMHSLLLDIGKIIVEYVILPLTVSLLGNFIYGKIKSMHEKEENVNVRVEIIAEGADGTSKSIRYEGPASGFDAVKKSAEKVIKS